MFISYAHSTAQQARAAADALRAAGYSVWLDDDLPAHRAFSREIDAQLTAAKAALVLWSADAAMSDWVLSEANRAREEHKLVQLRLDVARLPMPFDQIQCADLGDWRGEPDHAGWQKVLASIAELTGGDRRASAAAGPASTPSPHVRICVLPFVNMSGEAEQDYFSDGITEDIITDLAKVSALSVVARNTAFTFKGKAVNVAHVARQLNVSHLLEGSVRKTRGRVRITAQLIDGAAGDHIWAERYDRALDDIFALQDEISQAIVAALRLRLLPEERRAIGKRGTASAAAYDLYLMARQYRERGSDDARQHETIIRLCERAIAIDPDYAQAWTVMGAAQMTLARNFGRSNDGGAAAIARALRIDPDLGEARSLHARELHQAGRVDEALAELDAALKLDPESFDVNARAGGIFYQERRLADALACFEKAAALNEADFGAPGMMLSAAAALGDENGVRRAAHMTVARAETALAQDRRQGPALAQGAMALAALGERARAMEWVDRALLLDPDNAVTRYNLACALAHYLQDADGALRLLGPLLSGPQAAEAFAAARSDPDLDPIRDDPRLTTLLAETGARLAGMTSTTPS